MTAPWQTSGGGWGPTVVVCAEGHEYPLKRPNGGGKIAWGCPTCATLQLEHDTAMARESTATDLVALLRGIIAGRRDKNCGGLVISDDVLFELANGIASCVLATYELTDLK